MKKLLILSLLSPFLLKAQEKPLLAEGISPGLYITHKVAAKENYYSVGRIYNISPKEIAPFNNLQLEIGLTLGQVIKVPLSTSNFFQSGTASEDEIFVPVYYIVKGKEGLYRVAIDHNNLPLETLKRWNNIKGDNVKNGTKLIIGYLKVKKEQSYLAKNGVATTIDSKVVIAVNTEEKKPPAENPNKKITAEETGTPSISIDKNPIVKNPESEKTEIVPAVSKKTANTGNENPVGAFKSLYDSQIKNAESVTAEGRAGIFKSTSGWTDKKYYCLHNSASAGTIIKITNTTNGKFVYAKVLDLMPDIKQNSVLQICISNAAAAELGVSEKDPSAAGFNCLLNYSK
jgi:LysM repeat protein